MERRRLELIGLDGLRIVAHVSEVLIGSYGFIHVVFQAVNDNKRIELIRISPAIPILLVSKLVASKRT